nr:uncharacterized mitochondrial protein AtMg00810-like [Tanacetum cinerariifolium]
LAKKNELEARGTLLMALPDKHQLNFNSHKDAKTLMEAIEKRFGGNTETKKVQKTLLKQQYANFIGSTSESFDQIHDRLQKLISQLEILGFSISQEDINLNTNEPVSAATSVSAVSAKIHVSSLPNVDSLSNRTGRNLGSNGPTSMGFDMSKVECYNCHRKGHFARKCSYDWSFQAEEEPTNYALMAFSSSSSSSDNEVVSCSKAYNKAYATLQSHYDKQTENYRKSQFDVISYHTCLGSVEARLLVYQQNKSVFKEDIKLLKLEVQLRDNALVSLRQNIEKEKQERDDLKLKLEKSQTSSKNLYELLASQKNDKTGLGYNSQVFTRVMFDCDDYLSSGSDESLPLVLFMIVLLSLTKTCLTNRPSTPIIEDWISDSKDESKTKTPHNVFSFVQSTEQVKSPRPSVQHVETFIPAVTSMPTSLKPTSNSKLVFITAVRPVSTDVPKIKVTRPRHDKPIVTKPHSPNRRYINHSPSPKASNSPPEVTVVQAPVVNVAQGMQGKWEWKPKCPILDHGNSQHALKDNGVIDSGCLSHMTENMSYLSDFEELNGGYVAFGGNPKGGKISRKGKIKTGKLDFDDVYFVKELKFNLFGVLQMCDKKNSVLFTDTKYLILSLEFKLPDASQVLLRVPRENNMYNFCGMKGIKREFSVPRTPQQNGIAKRKNRTLIEAARTMLADSLLPIPFWAEAVNTACYVQNQEPEFDEKKPESEVNVSQSSSAQSKKHDDKTKREAKSKSPMDTNTFSVAGPSNAAASLTHRKSSCIDASQLLDDPDMPELEDITYSNDEDDVGVEADFKILETSIIVSLIPTTRVHKDHPVTQIIGDLSSATQTKSIARVAKDQGGLSQMFNDDFHTCLQVKQKKDGIFISQDKYVAEILRKFRLIDRKSASTPIDTEKPLLKDTDGEYVDVHAYRSMIGSLMYLTSSRLDIMFAVYACARFQVTPKALHLHAYFTAVSSKVSAVWSDKIGAAHLVLLGHQFWTTIAVKKVNDVTRKQVGDLSTHTTKYTSPALTQKVFANMRRVGVPAAGIIIEGVVSAADDVVPTADEEPSIPSPTPPTPPPQPSHDIPSTS